MYNMEINDYIKVAKMMHEIIRRTGVDHEGKELTDDERCGR